MSSEKVLTNNGFNQHNVPLGQLGFWLIDCIGIGLVYENNVFTGGLRKYQQPLCEERFLCIGLHTRDTGMWPCNAAENIPLQ